MSHDPLPDCLFCRLAAGEGNKLIWESDKAAAFNDIHPDAPVHIQVVPKRHIVSLAETDPSDQEILGHLLLAVGEIARQLGLDEKGYRTIINTREHGGQEVDHLHLHILGGEIIGPLRHRS